MRGLGLKHIPNVPFERTFAQEMDEQELVARRKQQTEPVEPYQRTAMTARMMVLSHHLDSVSSTKSKCTCITSLVVSTMEERCAWEDFVEWTYRATNGARLTRTIDCHLERRYGSASLDEAFVQRVKERINETNCHLSFKELCALVS